MFDMSHLIVANDMITRKNDNNKQITRHDENLSKILFGAQFYVILKPT